jgi:4-amino-4-deoxy-L-arabinose transferase-like glycosyltransferase
MRSVASWLGAILLLAGALRVHHLGRESLWLDEAVSLDFAHNTVRGLIHDTAQDVHPPLYYLALKTWIGAAGDSEPSARALSVVFSLLTVVATFALAARWFDRSTALVASLLVAVAPLQISFAQEARMYALLAFLGAISLEAWLTTVRRGGRWGMVRYVLSTAAMLYTHAYASFVIAGELAWLAFVLATDADDRAGRWRRGLFAFALAVIAFMPWFSTEVAQVRSVEQGFWISSRATIADAAVAHAGSAPLAWIMAGLGFLAIVGRAALGDRGPEGPRLLHEAGRAVLRDRGPEGPRLLQRSDSAAASHLAIVTCLCVVGLPYLLSRISSPIFMAKYTVAGSVAFLLLVARGITLVPWRPVRGIVLAGLMALAIVPLEAYYDTQKKDDWRGVTAFVEREAQPGDLVVFTRSYGQLPFDYYVQRTDLVELPFLDTRDGLTSLSIDVLAKVAVGPCDRVWLVTSLPDDATQALRRAVSGRDEMTGVTRGNLDARLFVRRASLRVSRDVATGSPGAAGSR